MAPWPLIDDFHDTMSRSVREKLGDGAPAVEAAAARTDPWPVADDALAELSVVTSAHGRMAAIDALDQA
jgi:hypothetical protein